MAEPQCKLTRWSGGKNSDEGSGEKDCPPPDGDEKLFCCALGYCVLVKDSIVIMSEEGS